MRNVPQPTPAVQPGEHLTAQDAAWVDTILARYRDDRAPLIPVLQDVTDERRYLPRPVLEYVAAAAEDFRWPRSSAWPASTTPSAWRRWVGTRSKSAWAPRASSAARGCSWNASNRSCNVAEGETDSQGRFTLRTVRCIGCCALAPAMRIDGVTFGKVKLDKVVNILEQFA